MTFYLCTAATTAAASAVSGLEDGAKPCKAMQSHVKPMSLRPRLDLPVNHKLFRLWHLFGSHLPHGSADVCWLSPTSRRYSICLEAP